MPLRGCRVPPRKRKRSGSSSWISQKNHNIDYQTDETGNVVMRVPGTKGYENRPCVILQSHMDMVCEKNSDTAFDFDKDPIRTKIVDGWVKAEGTTLGADDGIGMAAALAALLNPALEHGPLEALFTVDEETGLTGAFGLGKGMLTGRYLVEPRFRGRRRNFHRLRRRRLQPGGPDLPFMGEKLRGERDYQFIAVEPASCPSLTRGVFAYDFCDTGRVCPLAKMYTLGSGFIPSANHAGGLRYHGMSPVLSELYHEGLMEARSVEQTKVLRRPSTSPALRASSPRPRAATPSASPSTRP